eukprot:m.158367 g.158367  ORF g.158367 m.158367 type:complete len:775 (+) comp17019_c1_seq2:130-2454(+)
MTDTEEAPPPVVDPVQADRLRSELERKRQETAELERILGIKKPKETKEEAERRYKVQRVKYEEQKRRLEKTFADNSNVDLKTGILKMRSTIKTWSKFWFVLRPGMLIYFKENKRDDWAGTILLSGGQVVERPSKKEGFCFKFSHPLKHPIHADRGPKGEIWFNINIFPTDYCILRASSEEEGRAWLAAIDLSINMEHEKRHKTQEEQLLEVPSALASRRMTRTMSQAEDDSPADEDEEYLTEAQEEPEIVVSSTWVEDRTIERWQGPLTSTVSLEVEHKRTIWQTLKQLSPGHNLTTICLPPHVQSGRSLLETLSDPFQSSNLLTLASQEEDGFKRLVLVTRWVLSWVLIRPNGWKKPYNPLLGEVQRCMYEQGPQDKTLVVLEQVSHHPPISALYASNRPKGWIVDGSLEVHSDFHGDAIVMSTSGRLTVHLLTHDERFDVVLPKVVVRGLLLGSMLMELGGQLKITSLQSPCSADLMFSLRWQHGEPLHTTTGTLNSSETTSHPVRGAWHKALTYAYNDKEEMLSDFSAMPSLSTALRHVLPLYEQWPYTQDVKGAFDSESTWKQTTDALLSRNMSVANEQKGFLESTQRAKARQLAAQSRTHSPKFFEKTETQWVYRHANFTPWNTGSEACEVMHDGIITSVGPEKAAAIQSVQSFRPARSTSPQMNVTLSDMRSGSVSQRPSRLRRRLERESTCEEEDLSPRPPSSGVVQDVTTMVELRKTILDLQLDMQRLRGKMEVMETSNKDTMLMPLFYLMLVMFAVQVMLQFSSR